MFEMFDLSAALVSAAAAATIHSNMSGEYVSDTETLARSLLPIRRHVCIFVVAVPSVTRTDHRQALSPRLRSA